jgi:signal transduction histidine kinase
VLRRALHFVRHQIVCAGINCRTEWTSHLPALNLDQEPMEQVFINLLMNAIDAMPAGGTLTVRTSLLHLRDAASGASMDIAIEIEDSGSGISPEQAQRMFEPYFTTKPPGAGTGLGLAICRQVVELHGGSIRIENKAQGGAKVTVVLPVKGL